MFSLNIHWDKGKIISKLQQNTAALKVAVQSGFSPALAEAAFLVEREGKNAIRTGSTRAIKSGFLMSSIGVASVLPYRAKVSAFAYYGVYVHEGTRYMRARPFMEVGLKNAVPGIEKIFHKRVKAIIEKI